MSLSEPAQLLVNHILYLISISEGELCDLVLDGKNVQKRTFYVANDYPIMADKNHETGKMIEKTHIVDGMPITTIEKEVIVVQEEEWVQASREVIKEAEDYLMSQGYMIARPRLKSGKVIRGCFVIRPSEE